VGGVLQLVRRVCSTIGICCCYAGRTRYLLLPSITVLQALINIFCPAENHYSIALLTTLKDFLGNVISITCFCILKETSTYSLTSKRVLFPSPPSPGYSMTNEQAQTEAASCLRDSSICLSSSSQFPAGKVCGWLRRCCSDLLPENLYTEACSHNEAAGFVFSMFYVHCAIISLSGVYRCHFLFHNIIGREKEEWGVNKWT